MFAVVTADSAAEAWEEATGEKPSPALSKALAATLDSAYSRGFNGLGAGDLVSTCRRLAPEEPLVAIQLMRDWYESGQLDAAREGGVLA